MPNIVAKSDFVDEIAIANNEIPGFGSATNSVDRLIAKYEPRFLNMLFGSDFATLFIAGLFPPVTDPITPVDARWTALNTPELKLAIANYIYYYWQRSQDTQTMGTGTVKSKNTNSIISSAADKVSRAWNEMRDIVWSIIRFMKLNAATYPEYVAPRWLSFWCWDWGFDDDNYWSFRRRFKIPDIFYPLSRL